ncbi:CapA family protein [Streptomyces sp. DSM 42041]|uniref:CapA family protein n=1 Tax=Streptomyces hazeniae TaxID=3075538 RepID=A0ABU2NY51_9ACTN|nr:CapA family protein [Streptomyces sp. DSM 42041]MDT0381457.1 CapA family protein [Streptomyces sp. DSM 42041]
MPTHHHGRDRTRRRPLHRVALACAVTALLTALPACGADRAGDDGAAADGGRSRDAAAAAHRESAEGFTLVATGDILAHDSIIQQARRDAGGKGYDFRPMLAAAEPLVSAADLAVCHMETVYGADGGPFTGYPAFQTPPHVAEAIAATGYDSCSTASNHTLDAGPDGVRRTLDALDEAGVRHVGSARSAKEDAEPVLLDAGDAKVAQLAYTYGTNGIPVPDGKPWLVDLLDPRKVVADARAARKAGADVVVVSVHWGTEWQQEPDTDQLRLAKELTASRSDGRRDIDLILGTHNHVPQAYEKVNGTWVVYGLGDQVAGVMNDPRGSMGSAARFTFAPPRREGGEWRVRKADFTPFLMASEPRFRLVDLTGEEARGSGRPQYTAALNGIREAVLARGAADDGLTMTR